MARKTEQRDKLILEHMDMVEKFVHGTIRPELLPRALDKDDLIQHGNLILIKCAEKYDEYGGIGDFEKYAYKCVRNGIFQFIVNTRFGPKSNKYWKEKKSGANPYDDFISYDEPLLTDNGEPITREFAENIWSAQYVTRILDDQLLRVLVSAARLRNKAKDEFKRDKKLSAITKPERSGNVSVFITICGVRYDVGEFSTYDMAAEAYMIFLNNLILYCEEKLHVTT